MKKFFPILGGLVLSAMVACNTQVNEDANEVAGLRTYVDSVSALDWSDESRTWDDIDVVYRQRLDQIEANAANLDDAQKSEYEKIKSDYENLRTRYTNQQAQLYRTRLRNSLFGDGVISDDMNFAFMTPENAATTYERFITTIESNRNNYTAKDWEEIWALYGAMETRKGEFKDLEDVDDKRISSLRVKYDEIKDQYKDLKDDTKDAAEDAKDAAKDAKDEVKDAAEDDDDN